MSFASQKLPILDSERKTRTRRIHRYTPPSAPRQASFIFAPDYNLRGLGEGMGSIIWGSVMPAQVWHARGWTGEKALMAAVLADAIKCVRDGKRYARMRRKRRLGAEAEAWMRENDVWWPFSFVNICTEMGVDPGMVRAAVLGRRG